MTWRQISKENRLYGVFKSCLDKKEEISSSQAMPFTQVLHLNGHSFEEQSLQKTREVSLIFSKSKFTIRTFFLEKGHVYFCMSLLCLSSMIGTKFTSKNSLRFFGGALVFLFFQMKLKIFSQLFSATGSTAFGDLKGKRHYVSEP